MKILFVTRDLPINNGSGGSIRSYQIYRDLQAFSSVDVLCCNGMGVRHRDAVRFAEQHNYLGNARIPWHIPWFKGRQKPTRPFRKLLSERQYDYVVVRYHLSAFWLGLIGAPNLILDCDDCVLELETQKLESFNGNLLQRLFKKLALWTFKRRYISDLQKVPVVTFAKRSRALEWRNHFHVLPNKIKPVHPLYDPDTPNIDDPFTVLFVGVLSYRPNCTGLDWFIGRVWPAVIAKHPHAILKVVGRGLPPKYREKWEPVTGVQLCGFVEDIDQVYADAAISISPVFAGSGTHIKVMESLMRSTPMVISRMAHRGYEDTLLDGESLYVADNGREFAEKIGYLIEHPGVRSRMGELGRERVLACHKIKDGENDLLSLIEANKNEQSQSLETYHYALPGKQTG